MLSVPAVLLCLFFNIIKKTKKRNRKERCFTDAQWLVWPSSSVVRVWNKKLDTEIEWSLLYPKEITEDFHLKVTK